MSGNIGADYMNAIIFKDIELNRHMAIPSWVLGVYQCEFLRWLSFFVFELYDHNKPLPNTPFP